MENVSTFELIVMVSMAIAALLGVIALIDVIRRPAWQWSQSNRSKGMWVGLLLLGIFFGAFGGLFFALIYYLWAQPALKRARPPILPPGGRYHATV